MREPSIALGNKRRRVLVITLGSTTGTSARLFRDLSETLSEDHDCRSLSLPMTGRSTLTRGLSVLGDNLRHLPSVVWAQVVIVHVPAALSLPLLLAARALGRKVIIFQWDVYPVTLSGQDYAIGPMHRLAHSAERFALRLAQVTSLPTEDFRGFSTARNPVIMPLWPERVPQLEPVRTKPREDQMFHIAFAGQINPLRGLAECVAFLRSRSRNRIVLHLFSADPFVGGTLDDGLVRVEHHGQLARDRLQDRLREMDFGLISLHPRMDQPGFPSKTYDYLAAGLPLLYFGRPLPAFVQDLQACGVGIEITTLDSVDLGSIHPELTATMTNGRAAYLAGNGLNRERLAKLL